MHEKQNIYTCDYKPGIENISEVQQCFYVVKETLRDKGSCEILFLYEFEIYILKMSTNVYYSVSSKRV